MRFACERVQMPVTTTNLDLVILRYERDDDRLNKANVPIALRASLLATRT